MNNAAAYIRDSDRGTQTYTWAQPDRLATLTQGSTTTTYTYDGDGLRLQASTGTQAAKKTNFEWDVNSALPKLVAERDGSGGPQGSQVREPED